jgi:hypothetical protein
MKRTKQLVTITAAAGLFAGTATAMAMDQSGYQEGMDGKPAAVQAERATEDGASDAFPKYSWERGHLLQVVEQKMFEQGATHAIKQHPWERGQLLKVAEQKMFEQGATHAIKQHPWERGQLLKVAEQKMFEQGATHAIKQHPWERGEMLNLIRDTQNGMADADGPATAPRVTIYFDQTGTQPGLPGDLGNTHAGRSIMLKYLDQARTNAAS